MIKGVDYPRPADLHVLPDGLPHSLVVLRDVQIHERPVGQGLVAQGMDALQLQRGLAYHQRLKLHNILQEFTVHLLDERGRLDHKRRAGSIRVWPPEIQRPQRLVRHRFGDHDASKSGHSYFSVYLLQ